ncbi:MAG: hypothetical protein IT450_04775 [Phycisphaerales bacterium]|nr:hypothetical protein [Phycisphaerales bacterium]
MPERLVLDFSMRAWFACAIPPAIGGALLVAALHAAAEFWDPKDRLRYWLHGLIPFLRYPSLYSLLRPVEAARGSAFAIALYAALALGTIVIWGGATFGFVLTWVGEWRFLAVWAGGALAGGVLISIPLACSPKRRA